MTVKYFYQGNEVDVLHQFEDEEGVTQAVIQLTDPTQRSFIPHQVPAKELTFVDGERLQKSLSAILDHDNVEVA